MVGRGDGGVVCAGVLAGVWWCCGVKTCVRVCGCACALVETAAGAGTGVQIRVRACMWLCVRSGVRCAASVDGGIFK